MPIEVGIWRLGETAEGVKFEPMPSEGRLEEILARNISILDPNLLLVGRQVETAFGKVIDLLGMDADGNLVLIELIPKEIIDAALRFIDKALKLGGRVLVHCNLGESRSPSLGLLYLAIHTDALPRVSLVEAEVAFRRLYPAYSPKGGMRCFLANHWNHYVNDGGGAP